MLSLREYFQKLKSNFFEILAATHFTFLKQTELYCISNFKKPLVRLSERQVYSIVAIRSF